MDQKVYAYQPGQSLMTFVTNHYFAKYPDHSEAQFKSDYELYEKLPAFKASENIHEVLDNNANAYKKNLRDEEDRIIKSSDIKPEVHWIVRCVATYYMTKVLEAMKIDLTDPNIAENALLKGTAGRWVKMFTGNDLEDTSELGSGRWNKEPYISVFPNEGCRTVIWKKVDLVSCCSHHFLPFSTLDGGEAIIGYKPSDYVIGISKLQRLLNWAARRCYLQENLTDYLGKTIQKIAKTQDVYVKLANVVHGCEKFRGVNSRGGSLTTEFKGGMFADMENVVCPLQ